MKTIAMKSRVLLTVLTLFFSVNAFGQEDCFNGIDDDADGDIDLNDDECTCDIAVGGGGGDGLIPNPSFEDYSCCPSMPSQLNCADDWIQASGATSDYFNTCNYTEHLGMGAPEFPLPGDPGDAGYAGFHNGDWYKEYIGAEISSPLVAGTSYVINFYLAWSDGESDFNVTFYGTPTVADLPWSGWDCPTTTGDWVALDDQDVSLPMDGSWQEFTFTFTPTEDMHAVCIGPSCTSGTPVMSFYFIDNLTLMDSLSFSGGGGIVESGDWCNEDLTLSADCDTAGGSWQWFYEGVALVGETGPTLDAMPTGEGTYQAAYILDGDCFLILEYDLEIILEGSFDITLNHPTCYGFEDGSVTVSTSGSPTIEIVNESGEIVNVGGSNTANELGSGDYDVNIVTGSGCSQDATVTLIDPPPLSGNVSVVNPQCYGDDGSAEVTSVDNAQGDLGNITYIWSPDPNSSSGVGNDNSGDVPAGTYTVTINDDFGCSDEIEFTVVDPERLEFVDIGVDPAYCRIFDIQNGNGVVWAAAAGGSGDFTYLWTHLETGDTETTSTWGGLNPGTYDILVTDDNGCTLSQSLTVDELFPIADFEVVSDELNLNLEGTAVVCASFVNQSLNFANPNNPNADTTFWWNLDTPNDSWELTHDYDYSPEKCYPDGGTYEVCLKVQNKNGCVDSTCKTITVFTPLELTAPNVFSPNENGINDEFTFEYLARGVTEFNCLIVNRWGDKIAEINDINSGWDGRTKKGIKCPDGVYFYTYSGTAENGERFEGQGTVQIIASH